MKSIDNDIDLLRLIPPLQEEGAVVLLESQSYTHPAAQKTLLAARPQAEIFVYENRIVIRREGEYQEKTGADVWEELKQFQSQTDGWLFGYLGYDLKNQVEQLCSGNQDPVQAPDLYMMNPGLLVEDTSTGRRMLKGDITTDSQVLDLDQIPTEYTIGDIRPQVSEEEYRGMIRKAQSAIQEGTYYEINLSHQMRGSFSGAPLGLYEDMKSAGPVPFGAFISFKDRHQEFSICSASPERFLGKRANRVFSQPIKGTVSRGATAAEDRDLKRWLSSSEKNRAENLMIVDLVRNDLGKIATPGSVRVSNLFEVQTFETVHQMVSTVEAEAPGRHPVDIIRACFPMGSMTGAPKISAMRGIEHLENYRRGIYSGAIGYLAPEGDIDFNVVIRTAVIRGEELFYCVGGAITSDSDPREEWRETLVKAKALTTAVSPEKSGVAKEPDISR
ncbi:aminodeoxychorismate synthase component I [Halalkalibaculum sp. DA3122]|uniref:aminodeoxychorismate synthase component I n=1 Tax=Halalkalibaculum sp. DA3122 TaxID=3373607 RepID=UPI003754B73D